MTQTYSITVKGKVQGVYYRQSTKEKALQLGITGYVKNQPDGSVKILASGTTEQLLQLVMWCKQGPARAEVASVDVETVAPHAFFGFSIER
ncbi:acylphosphatase [Pseudoflavitalea sp. G-6-1-2]|uniref:acylphosphatase n=1 Tax=Pseudoflavitalea sp. G-6-1-2 TaxID=2728841 RepID=UPI00146B49C9|nr:acylphosphatase [Pseudoflavitalea sp. G-6-1-2]NML21033.1 acylphosphatase [Pseudoflavitalea sp. G-6-1-2]